MPSPIPPVNVRLVYADTTEQPVDCIYTGLDDTGTHQWAVINTRPDMPCAMRIDVLPPRTTISLDYSRDRSPDHG